MQLQLRHLQYLHYTVFREKEP